MFGLLLCAACGVRRPDCRVLFADLDPTLPVVDTEAHPELVIGKTDSTGTDPGADAELVEAKKSSLKISNKKVPAFILYFVAVVATFTFRCLPWPARETDTSLSFSASTLFSLR